MSEQMRVFSMVQAKSYRPLAAGSLIALTCLLNQAGYASPVSSGDLNALEAASPAVVGMPPLLLADGRKSKLAVEKHYAVHPILKTKARRHFNGTLSASDFDNLSNLFFDANYIEHATAERDAAELFCKFALAGNLNDKAGAADESAHGPCDIAIGFSCIHVKLKYHNGVCVAASIVPAIDEFYTNNPYRTISWHEKLIHPVLGTTEFEDLGRRLTDRQLHLMAGNPGYLSLNEATYVPGVGCFRAAESEAALQFRDRIVGLSGSEILSLVGAPQVKTGPVKVWGDSRTDIKNWIYYLGFEGIAVRLVLSQGRCTAASVLSERQAHLFLTAMIKRFSVHNPEVSGAQCKAMGIEHGGPEDKTEDQIIQLFGEPQSITKDSHGHPMFIYGTGPSSHVEIPIADGQSEGRISHIFKIGWPHRKGN
jgi:hypothetical protein